MELVIPGMGLGGWANGLLLVNYVNAPLDSSRKLYHVTIDTGHSNVR